MAPRDRENGPGGVASEADWPDPDAASHRFRVDHGVLRDAGSALAPRMQTYRQGPGSPHRLAGLEPAGAAWGLWESAAPVHAAARQAMRHVLHAYRLLLKDCEAAGRLLLQTAQNYADADAGTRAAAPAGIRAPAGGDGVSGEPATRLPVRKEDLSRLSPQVYGLAAIVSMLDAADPAPLSEAAAGWNAAAGALATLREDLRARAEVLAADWDGAAAAACQLALRRIAGTARQLCGYAEDVRSALSAAANAQQRAKRQLAALRAQPRLLAGIEIGGMRAPLLEDVTGPGLAEQVEATARRWMRALYDGYRSAMAALPAEVVFDLPGLVAPGSPGQAPQTQAPPAPAAPYGGETDRVGSVLPGGVAAGPMPLDPRQPAGGAWQGPGMTTAGTLGVAAALGAAKTHGAAPATAGAGNAGVVGAAGACGPPGQPAVAGAGPPAGHPATVADIGAIVGAIAEAVAGADRHRPAAEPAPGGVPEAEPAPGGVSDAEAQPGVWAVDAPYVAATVAEAVAVSQRHDCAGMPEAAPARHR